jgi:hypothetical protein
MTTPFQLIGLQYQGQALDWQWDGSAAGAETPFSQVLHTLAGLSPAVRTQAQALQLQRHKSAQADTWWLYVAASDWVCTLNGRALPLKQTWRLNDGDVIEIGFVRMQVKLQDEPQLFLPADPTHASPEADSASFNLVALALDNAQPKSRDGLQKPDDDISDLIGDTAAAPDFQSTTIAPAAGQATATVALLVDKVTDDPLSYLHEAYLRRLRSPLFNDPQEQWQSMQRSERVSTQDPLQHLITIAGKDPGLSDLLGQSNSIDVTMASFDKFSAVDILAPEPFDRLMHLFAPEEFVQAQAALNADSADTPMDTLLPGLTRREHHSLSLDSAMPIQKAKP